MGKTNRKCCLCGKEYYYCPNCDNGEEPTWKVLWDTENCKKIFLTITDYNFKNITANEAKKILETCDINANMTEKNRNTVIEILGTSTEAPVAKTVEETVTETIEGEAENSEIGIPEVDGTLSITTVKTNTKSIKRASKKRKNNE